MKLKTNKTFINKSGKKIKIKIIRIKINIKNIFFYLRVKFKRMITITKELRKKYKLK
jgi:hypothetical protein